MVTYYRIGRAEIYRSYSEWGLNLKFVRKAESIIGMYDADDSNAVVEWLTSNEKNSKRFGLS